VTTHFLGPLLDRSIYCNPLIQNLQVVFLTQNNQYGPNPDLEETFTKNLDTIIRISKPTPHNRGGVGARIFTGTGITVTS
jgi:hypothetical protein